MHRQGGGHETLFGDRQSEHQRVHDQTVIADDRVGAGATQNPILADVQIALVSDVPQIVLGMVVVDAQRTQTVQHVVQGVLGLLSRGVDFRQARDQRGIDQAVIAHQQIVAVAAIQAVVPGQHATIRQVRPRDDLSLGIHLRQRTGLPHHVGHEGHQRPPAHAVGPLQRACAGQIQQCGRDLRQQFGQDVSQGEFEEKRLVQTQRFRVQGRRQLDGRAERLQDHAADAGFDHPQAVEHVRQIARHERNVRRSVAKQHVIAAAAAERVVAPLAEQYVVAVAPVQHVVGGGRQFEQ